MIVETGIMGFFTLLFVIWYMSIKINSVKTVGICKKNLNCSGGCKGMFEYEIDGVKHYNGEKTTHFGSFKIEKKYTIYVSKNNHVKFVSRKVLNDLLIFIIMGGSVFFASVFLMIYEMFH